eukprot:1160605-Pelagomonas_calceolata.AAC.4
MKYCGFCEEDTRGHESSMSRSQDQPLIELLPNNLVLNLRLEQPARCYRLKCLTAFTAKHPVSLLISFHMSVQLGLQGWAVTANDWHEVTTSMYSMRFSSLVSTVE